MRRAPAVALILLASVLSAGKAESQDFSGTGPLATAPFALPAGAVIVEMEHEGSGEFRARLMDRQGSVVEELARVTGRFAGSRAVQVSGGEGYLLDVSSSGPWHIRFGEPGSREGEPPPEEIEAHGMGAAAAAGPGTWGWFGSGVLAGAVSGPIGGIVVTRMAGRNPDLPSDVQNPYTNSAVLGEAFEEGFQDALRQRRQRAAVRGSVVGTAILAFVIIKYADIGRRGGESGEGPPPLFQFMGGFRLGR